MDAPETATFEGTLRCLSSGSDEPFQTGKLQAVVSRISGGRTHFDLLQYPGFWFTFITRRGVPVEGSGEGRVAQSGTSAFDMRYDVDSRVLTVIEVLRADVSREPCIFTITW